MSVDSMRASAPEICMDCGMRIIWNRERSEPE
jgi:hypothetical protein